MAEQEKVSTTVPLSWDEVYYTNCPMVSANNVDQELGWCREEFKKIRSSIAIWKVRISDADIQQMTDLRRQEDWWWWLSLARPSRPTLLRRHCRSMRLLRPWTSESARGDLSQRQRSRLSGFASEGRVWW